MLKTFVTLFGLGLGALLCSGCASTGGAGDVIQEIRQAKTELRDFTIADLQAADALAVEQGDAIAHQCYPVLISFVQSLPVPKEQQTIGAAVAFQGTRGVVKRVQAGIPEQLKMACSALLVDATMDVNRFVGRLGSVLAGGLPLPF